MVGEMCWGHGRRIEENNCLRETEKRNELEREREMDDGQGQGQDVGEEYICKY